MRIFILLTLSFICYTFPAFAQEKKSNEPPKCMLENSLLNFDLSLEFLEFESDKRIIGINVEVENKNINFAVHQDNFESNLKLYERIVSIDGKLKSSFSDEISTKINQSQYQFVKLEKTKYKKTILLSPGLYRLEIFLLDINSNWCGIEMKGFRVPAINNKAIEKTEATKQI